MEEKIKNSEHIKYIEHQKIKTTNPEKITKWKGVEWELKLNGFTEIFSQYLDLLDVDGKCICLGSRTGQEVASLRQLGFKDSIGIDLVEFEPYTIVADFHNLPFDDNSVSFVYSNAVDHVRCPDIWSNEINRVLKNGGVCLFNLQIGLGMDEYSVLDFKNVLDDFINPFFGDFLILQNKKIKLNVHAMNWEVLLIKN